MPDENESMREAKKKMDVRRQKVKKMRGIKPRRSEEGLSVKRSKKWWLIS